jgi:hypothetical protein
MRMFRGWFLQSKWRPFFRSVLSKSRVLLCGFCGKNNSMQRIIVQKCFLHKVGSICGVNSVDNFSQGRSIVTHDARPGRPVEIETEASVQRVEELIRADGRITTDSVATALASSDGLAYRIMHDCLKFRKLCPENWRTEKKFTECVCPCNIP